MGCDIHGVIERKYKGEWVGLRELSGEGRRRNYRAFALLAGVRGEGPEPLGVPDDMSGLSSIAIDSWRSDAHSHSWCSVAGFIQARLASEHDPEVVFLKEGDPRFADPLHHYLDFEEAWERDNDFDREDYRVVFWFDN